VQAGFRCSAPAWSFFQSVLQVMWKTGRVRSVKRAAGFACCLGLLLSQRAPGLKPCPGQLQRSAATQDTAAELLPPRSPSGLRPCWASCRRQLDAVLEAVRRWGARLCSPSDHHHGTAHGTQPGTLRPRDRGCPSLAPRCCPGRGARAKWLWC